MDIHSQFFYLMNFDCSAFSDDKENFQSFTTLEEALASVLKNTRGKIKPVLNLYEESI